MNKAELIRHEIEKRRVHNLAIGNPLFAAMAEEDIELLCFIDSLQEEPVSEDLEEAIDTYLKSYWGGEKEKQEWPFLKKTVIYFAKWQKEHLWKPADGDDLPEIDREVIALTQPYPNDEHLRVVFAHRPNKYTKVWSSDLGEEQVVEIERYDKGGWNIPNVKYWLDCLMPKEIEL